MIEMKKVITLMLALLMILALISSAYADTRQNIDGFIPPAMFKNGIFPNGFIPPAAVEYFGWRPPGVIVGIDWRDY